MRRRARPLNPGPARVAPQCRRRPRLRGAQVVLAADHGQTPDLTHLVATSVGDDSVVELIRTDSPVTYATTPAGRGLLCLRDLSATEGAWLVDLETGARRPTVASSNPVASPDGSMLAVTTRSGSELRVAIVALTDAGEPQPVAEGVVIGWVPG